MLSFLPLFAKIGCWFLDKYIKDSINKAALKQQWLATIHRISLGVAESVNLNDSYSDAKAKLDAKFDAMKQGENK